MLAKRLLTAVALGLGFLSTTTQVIILRELLVAFTGNELTVATTLAVWLLSVAAGCFIFKRLTAKSEPAFAGALFIIAGVVVVFQALLVRILDPIAGTLGEILSPLTVIGLSAACITPGALILGGLFVALVALASESGKARAVPLVYGYEAVGSAVAGALLSLLLLESTNSVTVMALGGLVGLASGGRLLLEDRKGGRRAGAAVLAVSVAVVGGVGAFGGRVDLLTRQIQWKPLQVERSVETRYGSIVVTGRGTTFDFFETGNLSHTIPDPLYAEESAHIPMLYHPAPERVLVIGGAGSGIIGEVVKHPEVRSVDFVELDPEMIRLTSDFAPSGWLEGSPGIEVTPVYGDGRKFVVDTEKEYDVVIISVGLPVTLQTARYYTVEFFTEVARLLDPGGIMALKVASGGAYLSPELGSLLASLRNTCRQVFSQVETLPGGYIHFLASPELPLAGKTDSLPGVLADRNIQTSFVDEYHLFDRLDSLRKSRLDSVTASYDTGIVNTDAKPISSSYAVARWAKRFESGKLLAGLVRRLTPASFVLGIVASAILAVLLLMRFTGSPLIALPGSITLYAVGLTSMFTQVLIIVAFQIVNGYVYGWIAALIASFMLGMGLASSAAGSRGLVGRQAHLPFLMAGLIALPVSALLALRLAGPLGSPAGLPLADILFAGLAFAAGALGGLAFALASTFVTAAGGAVVEGGALAYALDLSGATVAGFSTAFLAIPSLGIATSAYAVVAFNAILLVVILLWRLRGPGK